MRTSLELKTQARQLLGSLMLDIVLPSGTYVLYSKGKLQALLENIRLVLKWLIVTTTLAYFGTE